MLVESENGELSGIRRANRIFMGGNPCVNGPAQFKSVLLKGQVYIYLDGWMDGWTDS